MRKNSLAFLIVIIFIIRNEAAKLKRSLFALEEDAIYLIRDELEKIPIEQFEGDVLLLQRVDKNAHLTKYLLTSDNTSLVYERKTNDYGMEAIVLSAEEDKLQKKKSLKRIFVGLRQKEADSPLYYVVYAYIRNYDRVRDGDAGVDPVGKKWALEWDHWNYRGPGADRFATFGFSNCFPSALVPCGYNSALDTDNSLSSLSVKQRWTPSSRTLQTPSHRKLERFVTQPGHDIDANSDYYGDLEVTKGDHMKTESENGETQPDQDSDVPEWVGGPLGVFNSPSSPPYDAPTAPARSFMRLKPKINKNDSKDRKRRSVTMHTKDRVDMISESKSNKGVRTSQREVDVYSVEDIKPIEPIDEDDGFNSKGIKRLGTFGNMRSVSESLLSSKSGGGSKKENEKGRKKSRKENFESERDRAEDSISSERSGRYKDNKRRNDDDNNELKKIRVRTEDETSADKEIELTRRRNKDRSETGIKTADRQSQTKRKEVDIEDGSGWKSSSRDKDQVSITRESETTFYKGASNENDRRRNKKKYNSRDQSDRVKPVEDDQREYLEKSLKRKKDDSMKNADVEDKEREYLASPSSQGDDTMKDQGQSGVGNKQRDYLINSLSRKDDAMKNPDLENKQREFLTSSLPQKDGGMNNPDLEDKQREHMISSLVNKDSPSKGSLGVEDKQREYLAGSLESPQSDPLENNQREHLLNSLPSQKDGPLENKQREYLESLQSKGEEGSLESKPMGRSFQRQKEDPLENKQREHLLNSLPSQKDGPLENKQREYLESLQSKGEEGSLESKPMGRSFQRSKENPLENNQREYLISSLDKKDDPLKDEQSDLKNKQREHLLGSLQKEDPLENKQREHLLSSLDKKDDPDKDSPLESKSMGRSFQRQKEDPLENNQRQHLESSLVGKKEDDEGLQGFSYHKKEKSSTKEEDLKVVSFSKKKGAEANLKGLSYHNKEVSKEKEEDLKSFSTKKIGNEEDIKGLSYHKKEANKEKEEDLVAFGHGYPKKQNSEMNLPRNIDDQANKRVENMPKNKPDETFNNPNEQVGKSSPSGTFLMEGSKTESPPPPQELQDKPIEIRGRNVFAKNPPEIYNPLQSSSTAFEGGSAHASATPFENGIPNADTGVKPENGGTSYFSEASARGGGVGVATSETKDGSSAKSMATSKSGNAFANSISKAPGGPGANLGSNGGTNVGPFPENSPYNAYRGPETENSPDNAPYKGPEIENSPDNALYKGPEIENSPDNAPYKGPEIENSPDRFPYRGPNTETSQNNAPYKGTNTETSQNNAPHKGTNTETSQNNAPYKGTNTETSQNNAPYKGTNTETSQNNAPYKGTNTETSQNNAPYRGPPEESQRDETNLFDATKFATGVKNMPDDTFKVLSIQGESINDKPPNRNQNRQDKKNGRNWPNEDPSLYVLGWKTQYMPPNTPNITFTYEDDPFYGIASCPHRPVSKNELDETQNNAEGVVRVCTSLMRTFCLNRAWESLRSLLDQQVLKVKGTMLNLNLDSFHIKKRKLTAVRLEELSQAFEMHLFSFQLNQYRAKDPESRGPDKSPITRSVQFLSNMILKGLEIARGPARQHLIHLTRHLIKIAKVTYTKLLQDFDFLDSCIKCVADKELNYNDRIEVMSLLEFMIKGLGPLEEGDEQGDVIETFDKFFSHNLSAIQARVSVFVD